MKANPHLWFDGRCAAAFTLYEKCLGGSLVTMMTYGETPAAGQVPSGWGEKIIHATLVAGELTLTGCDVPPDKYEKPQGFTVLLQVDVVSEAERIFQALAEDGVVSMPLQQTFWAQRFGMLVDQFGTPWMINSGTTGAPDAAE
jgi:PhnB protein